MVGVVCNPLLQLHVCTCALEVSTHLKVLSVSYLNRLFWTLKRGLIKIKGILKASGNTQYERLFTFSFMRLCNWQGRSSNS